jgi:hypothetical protein
LTALDEAATRGTGYRATVELLDPAEQRRVRERTTEPTRGERELRVPAIYVVARKR